MRSKQKKLKRLDRRHDQTRKPITPDDKAIPKTLENGCLVVDETITEEQLRHLRLTD